MSVSIVTYFDLYTRTSMIEVSLLNKIYESKQKRRELLQQRMNCLDLAQTNCSNCTGKCCTFMANSMMITPIEAIDLRRFLYENHLWNDELKMKLQECVKEFRLHETFDLGRGRTFRRTYTCPFYQTTFPGCPLPTKVKPYGCLAFNPTKGTPADGESCKSALDLLEQREDSMPFEGSINEELKENLKLDWNKLPIPVALLEIDKRLEC